VFRGRPGQFLLVFFFPVLFYVALGLVAGFPAAGGVALLLMDAAAAKAVGVLALVVTGLALLAALVAGTVFLIFLYSAFFRTSYGYTLAWPERSWAEPAEPLPAQAGPVVGRPERTPPPTSASPPQPGDSPPGPPAPGSPAE